MAKHDEQIIHGYDIGVIRPELIAENFNLRGEKMPKHRLKAIKKGLRTLHTLETMAVAIYRYQITKKKTEHNRQLVAAMCNEMTHFQDFQVKLYEYGFKPSKLRFAYWIVGFVFALFSRVRGKKAVLRTGIWVESKAVDHYKHLLEDIEWDDDTRKIIEKNGADEQGHINRWRSLLESPNVL